MPILALYYLREPQIGGVNCCVRVGHAAPLLVSFQAFDLFEAQANLCAKNVVLVIELVGSAVVFLALIEVRFDDDGQRPWSSSQPSSPNSAQILL